MNKTKIKAITLSIVAGVFFTIGNIVPFSILKYITSSMKICNETEYDIYSVKSDFYSIYRLKKGECKMVDKKKVLRRKMPLSVFIYKEETQEKLEFSLNAFIDLIGDAPLLFGKKTMVISKLYKSDEIQPYKEVGGVNYYIK